MEDPIVVGPGVEIPLAEVRLRASRSSGPGGQHANVTASRVEASFEIAASAALDEEQRRRLHDAHGARVVAVAQDARSQARNRELALARLRDKLAAALAEQPPRRPTRPTQGSRARRRAEKARASELKRTRRRPPPDEV